MIRRKQRFASYTIACLLYLRRIAPINPTRPVPINASELGSGTLTTLAVTLTRLIEIGGMNTFVTVSTVNWMSISAVLPSARVPVANPLNVYTKVLGVRVQVGDCVNAPENNKPAGAPPLPFPKMVTVPPSRKCAPSITLPGAAINPVENERLPRLVPSNDPPNPVIS